ncbi:hypothetical protein [Streptococcus oricebi]|uniref:DUF1934 domain-containing protein n=1 Tax=Streptococcus oricebi TaxID=1547447 RepID=A0ABS5B314_9STRE|nr:hypothetical protein [Streptococcus oricebi]MBP2623228.1 hypothetical protein [Streptococcus oricebi]
MIKINNIEWIDVDTKEAELVLSDGENKLLVFSDGYSEFDCQVGVEFKEELYAMVSSDVIQVMNKPESVLPLGGFRQVITGTLIDKQNSLLKIGEYVLHFESDIPNDVKEGELLEFEVGRIDI